jgi:hypothetical protein
MKFMVTIAAALFATGVCAAPFPTASEAQSAAGTPDVYYLFLVYYSATNTTSPIQLGPFKTEKACRDAATLVGSKVTVGAIACLRN